MIDPGLKDKVVLVTGGNNPFGVGAAIARGFASQGAHVFIHFFRQETDLFDKNPEDAEQEKPGLAFFLKQQRKTADEVMASIRKDGGKVESWEGDFQKPDNVIRLFEQAKKVFGHVDILVNNAADYAADSFIPAVDSGDKKELWKDGPMFSTIDFQSHDRHFAVNSRAASILMSLFARHIIERNAKWGRIINISADCAWGCPKEVSYRASKYALESFSRSAAAELGPYGITVNVVSPGPVQTGYINREMEEALVLDIPLRRVGHPEEIADAVLFFASDQASWITGQLLFVHGGHRMSLGQQ